MRAAVIGIGSNSVRSLVADVRGAELKRLWRDREGTRLFAGLDEAGNLNQDSMDKTVPRTEPCSWRRWKSGPAYRSGSFPGRKKLNSVSWARRLSYPRGGAE